ncbi:hypothetical protein WG922_13030 [Ramlibacter sp. AN1015]|uniref:hypothetical protein n=1 Tax=Ramlibacter sp. AN1015 TaxID=3133428 RepID=UPI0030C56FC6
MAGGQQMCAAVTTLYGMKDSPSARELQERRSTDRPSRTDAPAARAAPGGRSGYGTETLRHYLREQLAHSELMRSATWAGNGESKPRAKE